MLEKYDYVILTYSLTMIPNWPKALECVKKYLKKDGYLAISDFSLTKYQSFFSKCFGNHYLQIPIYF